MATYTPQPGDRITLPLRGNYKPPAGNAIPLSLNVEGVVGRGTIVPFVRTRLGDSIPASGAIGGTVIVKKAVAPFRDIPASGGWLVLTDDLVNPTKFERIAYTYRIDAGNDTFQLHIVKRIDTLQTWAEDDYVLLAPLPEHFL